MHLPDDVSRTSNKIYEEVHLPPSDAAPTNVGNKRVSIDQLDEVNYTFKLY